MPSSSTQNEKECSFVAGYDWLTSRDAKIHRTLRTSTAASSPLTFEPPASSILQPIDTYCTSQIPNQALTIIDQDGECHFTGNLELQDDKFRARRHDSRYLPQNLEIALL